MTKGLPTPSLLDAGILPVGEIAHIARREGARPRAAYQSHKWFARRLAATARSLAIAAATPADANFWSAYYGESSCQGLTVLDPFMGGGVMLLEASRLGANVHGVDVEPVAAAVSNFQGGLSSLPDLSATLEELRAAVKPLVSGFYETANLAGDPETMLHAFWVQTHVCSNCEHEFDLHPNHRLAWNDEKKQEWIICAGCGEIHERKTSKKPFKCSCGKSTKPEQSAVDHGTAVCPCCSTRERLITVADRTGAPPRFRVFAVEVLPAGEERKVANSDRTLRKVTAADLAAFDRAASRLQAELADDPNFLAVGPIPREGRSDNRLIQYGYSDYGDLFNARQKLHLGLLGREIAKLTGPVGEAMKIAFSDHLTTNNMMCAYAGGWRRLTALFSIRAYRHIVRPVEINPWLEKNGRGTFPNAVRSVQRAADAMQMSVEPTVEAGTREVRWFKPGTWDVRCQDARDLSHIPPRSVDLVLTDPPYFNYIAYSELGHFFVPWMSKFGMIDENHLSAFPPGQLAKSGGGASAAKAFGERLTEVMKEVHRVCKPNARMVFTYQNLDGHGWQGLASALAAAGIRPVNIWPMFGDSGAGLHKRANSISWDCVVHCEITESPIEIDGIAEFSVSVDAEVEDWKARLEESGHSLASGDARNLAHALSMRAAFDAATSARKAPELAEPHDAS
jgi:Adenine-specific DNA methylase containing a Zn-ribbon